MNAPLIWIVLPFFVSITLWFLQEFRRLSIVIGSATCLLMIGLAIFLPIETIVRFGALTFEVASEFQVLGRQFVITDGDRALIILLFSYGLFWFLGLISAQGNRVYVSFGLAMISLAVAALSVQPFLYAALIIEIIVLLAIPILVNPGSKVGKGVMRLLIFQTIGMVLVLMAGWAAGMVEANPADEAFLIRAIALIGLGFVFLLAVFPFHTWIILIAKENSPFASGFVLNLLSLISLLLLLDFLNGYAWVREFEVLSRALRLSGMCMVIIGGVWAAFQNDFYRLLGFALMFEIGFALLAISILDTAGWQAFSLQILPRILAFAVLSLSLSAFEPLKIHSFDDFQGRVKTHPFASIGIMISLFSIAGLPILAGFPARMAVISSLAVISIETVIWIVAANLFMFFAVFRVVYCLLVSDRGSWVSSESWPERIYLSVGVLLLILFGVFPKVFLDGMIGLFDAFGNLMLN